MDNGTNGQTPEGRHRKPEGWIYYLFFLLSKYVVKAAAIDFETYYAYTTILNIRV